MNSKDRICSIQVDVPASTRDRIDELADGMGLKRGGFIRRAALWYAAMVQAGGVEKGALVVVRASNGTETVITTGR